MGESGVSPRDRTTTATNTAPGFFEAATFAVLLENQNACGRLRVKGGHQRVAGTQDRYNLTGWTVSDAQEDKLGRVPKYEAALMEIRILRDDGVTALLRKSPYLGVVTLDHSFGLYVR